MLSSRPAITKPDLQDRLEQQAQFEKTIERQIETARSLGLRGTPGFVVGRVDSNHFVKAEKLIAGAVPLAVFQRALNEMLASQ